MKEKMKAVVLNAPTKAIDIKLSEIAIPRAKPGWILIKIKAFGLNHSEQILRNFEIENAYIKKPIIPGIECAGEVKDPSDSDFKVGDKVVALMGGMGRSFNGSYAEYVLAPIHHVFKIDTNLTWIEIAAIPETYFTVWGSLFTSLHLKKEDTLLIRGATCSLGYSAIQIAKAIGCKIVATTHRKEKFELLKKFNIDEILLDDGNLKINNYKINKALELVGIKTIKNTLSLMDNNSIVCVTGILGKVYEWNHFDPIKDIPNGVFLTGFFSNYPNNEIVQKIFEFLDEYNLTPLYSETFKFNDIAKACNALDSGKTNGKIIIEV